MPREEARKIRLNKAQLALSKARYLEALRLLCALPGIPSVYYGDEIGMQGMADPWNRAPMAWDGADDALRAAVQAHFTAPQANAPRCRRAFWTWWRRTPIRCSSAARRKDGLDAFGAAAEARPTRKSRSRAG